MLGITAIIAAVTITVRYDTPVTSRGTVATLEFVAERDIRDAAFLVSDWPGYFAYFSPSNRIIAADMLTGNKSILEEMNNSGNAVRHLFDTASEVGRPIRYVIFMGNTWLIPSTNLRCVIYNDWLRLPSARNIIGQVYLGHPVETDLNNGFIVWDASNPRFDVSADDPLCQVETET
ncbi:MAG: hypothetical protein OXC95_02025 [Dehalococcoidia bacterium]|nr:hypothetical protein [Dehalococcoidia bacterium]